MEVRITSMESVRPFSPQVDVRKPFKLSYIDQMMPPVYVPLIFFYTQSNNPRLDSAQISSPLRESLSKALNVFYPISGRIIDNFCIDSFNEGVTYKEARVNGRVSDYLQPLELDKMNDLLPYEGYRYHPNPESLPLLAVQENVFDCGGIALSLCCSHNIFDGSTTSSFLRSWAAFCRGCNGEIPQPEMLEASSRLFAPQKGLSSMSSYFTQEGRYKSKAFAFDANAIATLRSKAKSESLDRPSRSEALAAFIWKHAMLACRSASGIIKPSILTQAVDLRRRMEPQLPDYAIGNLLGFVSATYESVKKDNIELHDLALRLRKSLKNFKMQESEHADDQFVVDGNTDSFALSSLFSFRMHQIDFGWGNPTWFGFPGVIAPAATNTIILKEIGEDKAVEAMITLEENIMGVLEHDLDFLAFANPNPHYH